MIFDNVIEQIQAQEKETEVVIVKLGEVTSVTPGGRAYVKHYGEGAPSTKLYTYIDGYFPEVGDKVALLPQGKTFIILGKINDKDPVEIYAKIKWVEENFCPIEYKHKLEDAADQSEILSFAGYELVPTSDNKDSLGSSAKNFKEIFIKKLTLDGESFTKIYQDRIFVVNSGTTYSLIATYAAGAVTLTPSADDMWKLGTSAAQLAEIWTKLFRGAWKSGNQTERQLSWNSNNALVPDSDNAVDLGSASAAFKNLFIKALIGATWKYNTNSANNVSWGSATEIIPNTNQAVSLGNATKQFNAAYLKEIYLNGTKFDPGEITLAELTAKSGNVTRTLTLSTSASGATVLPSTNNIFELGSSSLKFKVVYSTTFNGDLTGDVTGNLSGAIKDGNTYTLSFDSSHNFVPSATNAVSLGTSGNKYKNVYATDLIGDLTGAWKDGTYSLAFDNAHNLAPSATNSVSLGTSTHQYNKGYFKEIYLDGTKLDPGGGGDVSTNELVDKIGQNERKLTLTAANVGATILPSDANFELGSNTYKFKEIFASYFTGTLDGSIKVGNYTLSVDSSNVALNPSADNHVALGAASYQFSKGYFKELYVDGTKIDMSDISVSKLTATSGSSTRTITLSANSSGSYLLPATNNTYSLGNYSYQYKEIFSGYFCGGLRNYINQSAYQSIDWDNNYNFYPSTTNTISLGTSTKQFKNIYGQNIYVNGTAVSSDQRKKEEIAPLDWRYKEFFKNLNPVSFKYIDGTSGRKHTGFIAQEVEEAAEKAGLSDKDLAVVVKDPEGDYYLRYEEIIAVQTEVIQQLMAKVETLESEKKLAESKVNKLEARLQKIEQFLFEQ